MTITKHGKPVLAMRTWQLCESIIETLEIMTDWDLMAALRQGIKEIDQRKGIPWTSARKRLRL